MNGSNIAAAINAAHEQVEVAKRQAVVRAIECGKLLAEAKATVKHGEWDSWLEANCTFSARTARLYMKAAKHVGDDPAKWQRVADLSLRELAVFIAKTKADEVEAARLADLWGGADQRVKATFAIGLYEAGQINGQKLRAMLLAAGLTPEAGAANAATIVTAHVPPEKLERMVENLAKAGHPDLVAAMTKALVPAGGNQ